MPRQERKHSTDTAEALNYNGALDFHDGDDSTCEYDYDSNGALTRDSNRGINSITYDYGHHTYIIDLDLNNRPRNITNDYTPDGRKLLSKHVMSIPKAHGYTKKTTTDKYIDGLTLRGDTTLMWRFDGGYVDLNANGTPTCWNYYITDHLGSTRMIVDSNDNIRETINYYPFGSEMQMVNPALLTGGTSHPFRFTGKELDKLNSLNMYDFGARWYDVAGVPMWTSVDPLCEKYYNVTPYSYCAGNPVNMIDPDGREVWVHYDDENGNAQSFLYSAGMTCVVDNIAAKTIVSNLNMMHSNQDGATVLDAIIDSPTKYGIRQSDTHSEDGEGYFDPSTNIVNLNDANNTMAFAEEAFHMYQRVNDQGGSTDVNEVEAKLFSSKMNYEIQSWNDGKYLNNLAGKPNSSYAENMNNLFWSGYNEKDYISAVNNFFSGAHSGEKYKNLPGYHHGIIKRTPLIKNFLPVK